jgi:hypothetical protein
MSERDCIAGGVGGKGVVGVGWGLLRYIINLHDKIARLAGEADPDWRIGGGQVLPPHAVRRKQVH